MMEDLNSLVNRMIENQPLEDEKLEQLLSYTPAELADLIMSSPPVEDVFPPTDDEIEYAQKQISIPSWIKTGDQRESFEWFIRNCQNYLLRNRIKDTFPNHESRKSFENGMIEVLRQLDERAKQTKRYEESYVKVWKAAWDYNKYTRGSIYNITTAVDLITAINLASVMPGDVKTKLSAYKTELRDMITRNPDELDRSRTDDETDRVVEIIKDILDSLV